jgi:hypothetical protein
MRESLLCGLQLRPYLPGQLWRLQLMTWLCRKVTTCGGLGSEGDDRAF